MKNLPLILGLLSTVILSLYCIDFHTEPILQKLNYQLSQNNVEVEAKPVTSSLAYEVKTQKEEEIIEPSLKEAQVPRKIQPSIEKKKIKEQEVEISNVVTKEEKVEIKQENELDILAKKILEDMKKNKDNQWKQ